MTNPILILQTKEKGADLWVENQTDHRFRQLQQRGLRYMKDWPGSSARIIEVDFYSLTCPILWQKDGKK